MYKGTEHITAATIAFVAHCDLEECMPPKGGHEPPSKKKTLHESSTATATARVNTPHEMDGFNEAADDAGVYNISQRKNRDYMPG